MQGAGIRAEGRKVTVDSPTFSAEFDGPVLASVKAKSTGAEFCRRDDSVFPLELVYVNRDTLRQGKHQQVTVKQVSDLAVRIVVGADDSDREMLVALDPATGDLTVTPSGRSARRGVLAVRWNIPFAGETTLVLPCINGIFVESGREFPKDDRFAWPYRWNAQLAIAQRGGASLMVHSEDTAYKFKALNMGRKAGLTTLGFDSEQVGPVWDNTAAGGVEWRLNVYAGDWQAPATRYREWMDRTYRLEEKRSRRPAWTTGWRTSKYDVDYPDYFASAKAKAFMAKANAMGFRVMPHFNYFAVFLKHPFFQQVRDWQIRNVNRNEPEAWCWPARA